MSLTDAARRLLGYADPKEPSSEEPESAPESLPDDSMQDSVEEEKEHKPAKKPTGRKYPRKYRGPVGSIRRIQDRKGTIFRKRTTYKVIKDIIRNIIDAPEIMISKSIIELLAHAMERILVEHACRSYRSVLQANKCTLMPRFAKQTTLSLNRPNQTKWSEADVRAADQLLKSGH